MSQQRCTALREPTATLCIVLKLSQLRAMQEHVGIQAVRKKLCSPIKFSFKLYLRRPICVICVFASLLQRHGDAFLCTLQSCLQMSNPGRPFRSCSVHGPSASSEDVNSTAPLSRHHRTRGRSTKHSRSHHCATTLPPLTPSRTQWLMFPLVRLFLRHRRQLHANADLPHSPRWRHWLPEGRLCRPSVHPFCSRPGEAPTANAALRTSPTTSIPRLLAALSCVPKSAMEETSSSRTSCAVMRPRRRALCFRSPILYVRPHQTCESVVVR